METLLWLVAGHLVGDFAFQSEWMAAQKGKSWEITAYHAALYTASMLLVTKIGGITLPPTILLIFFVSHLIIDPFKARWHLIKEIWVDQLLHAAVIVVVFLMLQ